MKGLRMTKATLVTRVAEAAQESVSDTQNAVDTAFSVIQQAFEKGEILELRRFGSFSVRQKKQLRGRNPKTGRPFIVPNRTVGVFKPSKELTARVNVPAFPSVA